VAALRKFGAPPEGAGVTAEDFTREGTVYQTGVVPRRIDVLTAMSGVVFEEAFAGRVLRNVDGRDVPFLGREALLKNKRATGRAKDLVDAEALESKRRG
jgi:hypothetical protein